MRNGIKVGGWVRDSEVSETLGFLIGCLVFAGLLTFSITFGIHQRTVLNKKGVHPTTWQPATAYVKQITPSVSNSGDNTILALYYTREGKQNLTSFGTDYSHIWVGKQLKAYINRYNKLYVPIANFNKRANPFKVTSDLWPGFFIFLVGVIGGVIGGFAAFFALDGFLLHGFIIPLGKKRQSVYGMQTIPKPKRTKLVHTSDGLMVEREYNDY